MTNEEIQQLKDYYGEAKYNEIVSLLNNVDVSNIQALINVIEQNISIEREKDAISPLLLGIILGGMVQSCGLLTAKSMTTQPSKPLNTEGVNYDHVIQTDPKRLYFKINDEFWKIGENTKVAPSNIAFGDFELNPLPTDEDITIAIDINTSEIHVRELNEQQEVIWVSKTHPKITITPGERLITSIEATKLENAVDIDMLNEGLGGKVDAVEDSRLITSIEATKLANAVDTNMLNEGLGGKVDNNTLNDYSLKDTTTLTEISEVKTSPDYFHVFNQTTKVEKKISIANLLAAALSGNFTTARSLVGEKDGINNVFRSDYTYIEGSERLNINGSIYYPNSGFYYEGANIILSGAPVPEAADFMFLEALYTN